MTVGERIRARRKELGMSADTLAEKLGVSRSTVFRYENGDIEKLPADALEPIAGILHTSVAELMGWGTTSRLYNYVEHFSGEKESSPQPTSKDILIGKLSTQLQGMTDDEIKQVLSYAKFLQSKD